MPTAPDAVQADEEHGRRKPARRSRRTARRCCSSRDRTRGSRRTTTAGCSSCRPRGGAARVVVGESEPYRRRPRDLVRTTASRSTSSRTSACTRSCSSVPAAGGKPRQLTDGKHNIGGLVAVARQARVHAQRFDERGDVWTMSDRRHGADTGHARLRLPRRATSSSDVRKRSSGKAPTASTVEGLVTYPVDYQAGQKYPLAVMTHGGPQAADKYSIGSMVVRDSGARRQRLRRACSRTIAAAPATATRSCATWSGTTSRTRISTSWPASTS